MGRQTIECLSNEISIRSQPLAIHIWHAMDSMGELQQGIETGRFETVLKYLSDENLQSSRVGP